MALCNHCGVSEATLECGLCEKTKSSGDSSTEAASVLCHECSDKLHSGVDHEQAISPLKWRELRAKAEKELTEATQLCCPVEDVPLEPLIEAIDLSYDGFQEEIKKAMAELKNLLEYREAAMLQGAVKVREHKLSLLSQQREQHCKQVLTTNQVRQEMAELLSQEPSDSLLSQLQTKLSELQSCCDALRSHPPPTVTTLPGGTSCGFVPNSVALQHASACLVSEHRADVSVGEQVVVSAVGGMNPQGVFWVRILPDETGLQDVTLQNIATTIGMELSSQSPLQPLAAPYPGQLCCARYVQDARWYRARVVDVSKPNTATVFFLDYGNTDEISLTSLAPLEDKFQVYPFQMLQCCFKESHNLTYSRESRWRYTDLAHGNKQLTATITKTLSTDSRGSQHMVRLMDETSGEPFDIGATVVAMAELNADPSNKKSFRSRDIRYLEKPPPSRPHPTPSHPHPTPSPPSHPHPTSSPPSHPHPTPSPPSSNKPESTTTTSTSGTSDNTAIISEVKPSGTASDVNPRSALTTDGDSEEEIANALPSNSASSVKTASVHSVEESSSTGKSNVMMSTSENLKSKQTTTKGTEKALAAQDVVGKPPTSDKKPQALVKPLSLALEKQPSLNSVEHTGRQIRSSETDALSGIGIDGLYPAIKEGAESLLVYPSTDMQADGTFWAVMHGSDAVYGLYDGMGERLSRKVTRSQDLFTPVFFNAGDYCAAYYDEGKWGRARIEEIKKEWFKLRYIDTGEGGRLKSDMLVPLGSEFKSLPPEAICCSLADEDHQHFSKEQIEKFDRLPIFGDDAKQINVLRMEGGVVYVKLYQESTCVNEVIYATGKPSIKDSGGKKLLEPSIKDSGGKKLLEPSIKDSGGKKLLEPSIKDSGGTAVKEPVVEEIKSMSFTLRNGRAVNTSNESFFKLPPPSHTTTTKSWAEQMDELQSPKNDGFLTLAGQNFDRSKSQSPSPSSRGGTAGLRSGRSESPISSAHSIGGDQESKMSNTNGTGTQFRFQQPSASQVLRQGQTSSTSGEGKPPRSNGSNPVEQAGPSSSSTARKASNPRPPSTSTSRNSEKHQSSSAASTTGEKASTFSTKTSKESSTFKPPSSSSSQGSTSKPPSSSQGSTSKPPSSSQGSTSKPPATSSQGASGFKAPSSSQRGASTRATGGVDSVTGGGGGGSRSTASRLDMGAAKRTILANITPMDRGRRRGGGHSDVARNSRGDGGVNYSQQLASGSLGEQWDASGNPQSRQPKGRNSPSHDHVSNDQYVRLFVKNVPADIKLLEDIRVMFEKHGKVHSIVPHQHRKAILYVYMDPEGGKRAMEALHGISIAKNCQPLVIETSYEPRRP